METKKWNSLDKLRGLWCSLFLDPYARCVWSEHEMLRCDFRLAEDDEWQAWDRK